MLQRYEDFLPQLYAQGLMTLAPNRAGLPCLLDLTQEDQWHTNLPSDPWPWRVRAVDEHDALFGKFFDRKTCYVAPSLAPALYVLRRQGRNAGDFWQDGALSQDAYRLYALLEDGSEAAAHDLKRRLGWTREQPRLERALAGLQRDFLLSCAGQTRKLSAAGQPYGWPVTTYRTMERVAGDWLRDLPGEDEAEDLLVEKLLPAAQVSEEKLRKWLRQG